MKVTHRGQTGNRIIEVGLCDARISPTRVRISLHRDGLQASRHALHPKRVPIVSPIVVRRLIAITCDAVFQGSMQTIDFKMVGEAGIEPTTPGLEGRCSIRLSYSPTFFIVAAK